MAEASCHFSPGELIEINTSVGPRYLQATHKPSAYPDVLRAIALTPAERPSDLAALAEEPTAFWVMADLAGALENGTLSGKALGCLPIPDAAQHFPTFRIPIRNSAGTLLYWWHWDGKGLQPVARGASDDDLPMRQVTDAVHLRRRLETLSSLR